jgi:hypothetical protein
MIATGASLDPDCAAFFVSMTKPVFKASSGTPL